jgi:hypothetical protein
MREFVKDYFLARTTSPERGGKFTDSLERDVERRFLFGGWPSTSSSERG